MDERPDDISRFYKLNIMGRAILVPYAKVMDKDAFRKNKINQKRYNKLLSNIRVTNEEIIYGTDNLRYGKEDDVRTLANRKKRLLKCLDELDEIKRDLCFETYAEFAEPKTVEVTAICYFDVGVMFHPSFGLSGNYLFNCYYRNTYTARNINDGIIGVRSFGEDENYSFTAGRVLSPPIVELNGEHWGGGVRDENREINCCNYTRYIINLLHIFAVKMRKVGQCFYP